MMSEAEKIKLGFIGGGPNSLIGQMHQIAAAMHDQYDLVGGIFGREFSTSISHARSIQISEDRVYSSLDALVEGEKCLPPSERMAVVAVLSPNSLHFEAAERLLVEGFHVICEKPMTTNLSDALALQKLVRKTGRIFCVTHTYTGYPMVRQMRELIAQGLLGEIRHVDARYLQGWIAPVLKSNEMSTATWRLDPNIVGDSCCFGDIGVHAFNLVEYTTGISIEQLLADLHTGTESNSLDVDGTALFRSASGVRGVIRASQIAAGEENNLAICVYGDKGALKWEQENPGELLHLPEGAPRQLYRPGNVYLGSLAADSTKLPPGHPEGLFDAMANIYSGAANAVKTGKIRPGSFPTIDDGVRGVRFIRASLESNRHGQKWVNL